MIRVIITFFIANLFILLTFLYSTNNTEDGKQKPNYSKQELFKEIDNLSKTPVVIMAHSNDGPSILYYTKHHVVGAPYHRQINGIISSYVIMEDKYSEIATKNTLISVDASYIFVRKPSKINKSNRDISFAQMIIENKLPEWISIVKLPEKFNDIIVAKINKELLRK